MIWNLEWTFAQLFHPPVQTFPSPPIRFNSIPKISMHPLGRSLALARPRSASFSRTMSSSSSFDPILQRTAHFAMKNMKYASKNKESHGTFPQIIPAWVADTDFASPEPIRRKLAEYITGHGVLGYTEPRNMTDLSDNISAWLYRRYSWKIEPEWVVHLPGIVPGFNLALRALKHPTKRDKCLVQVPNYPPMLAAAGKDNGFEMAVVRTLATNTGSNGKRRWLLDLDQLDKLATNPDTSVFLACNPTNPTGTVFSRSELDSVADIATRNDLVVVSDEIWADLILSSTTHIPAGSLEKLKDRSITLMAPSKTFNIAGLCSSFAVIPNPDLRKKFTGEKKGLVPSPGLIGSFAAIEAFSGSCDTWLDQQIAYLRRNRDLLFGGIERELEGLVDAISPDATFLAWLDCRKLAQARGIKGGVQDFFEQMGLGPSPGPDFGGAEYRDFARINFGAPRAVVEEMLRRLVKGATK